MAVVTLQAFYYLKVGVNVHAKILAIFSNVTIHLQAEHAVDVFVLDDTGLQAFESQQPYPVYYRQDNVSVLTTSLNLSIPQGQMAWVIIQSKGQPFTAVYYQIS